MRRRSSQHRGFTLVEILIVVIIMGVLASIVIGLVGNSSDDAARTTFAQQIKAFARAAQVFALQTGDHIEDASTGVLPAGFGAYVERGKWENGTPIGGDWDSELNSFGFTSGLGVHFFNVTARDDAYMQKIDAVIDDGDLATGGFRKVASDRFYLILVP